MTADAYLFSALALGFLGSLHCIGMCGPIALALPGGDRGASYKALGRLVYNAGRIVTYSAMGFAVGLAGFGIALQGLQSELSVAAGVLILLGVLVSYGKGNVLRFAGRGTATLKKLFKRRFGNGSVTSLFVIGMLNGLLPCGFVYVALAASAGMGHYAGSAAYMALFGLGTVPTMLAAGLTGQLLGMRFSRWVRKASPVVAIVIALLLIQRGDALSKKACHHQVPATEAKGPDTR